MYDSRSTTRIYLLSTNYTNIETIGLRINFDYYKVSSFNIYQLSTIFDKNRSTLQVDFNIETSVNVKNKH